MNEDKILSHVMDLKQDMGKVLKGIEDNQKYSDSISLTMKSTNERLEKHIDTTGAHGVRAIMGAFALAITALETWFRLKR